jgi:serine-type D-Ala-D-Ala carboxypeptidase/endopeptidase (penicillin-binding protein 4)
MGGEYLRVISQVSGVSLGAVVGLLAAIAPPVQAALCVAELAGALDAVIAAQPALQPARVGVLVETQGATPADRQRLYARDADKFFVPASNAKLLTTAAALDFLGPAYRIRTSVYGQASEVTELRVVGRGDPTITRDQLSALAQQVAQAGVRRVTRLVGDDSYFPGSAVNPNWEWEDVQAGYGAPVNGLISDRNAISLSLVPQAVGQPLQVVWDNPAQGAAWQIVNQSRTVAPGEPEFVSVGRDLGQPILYVSGQLMAGSAAETAAVAMPNPAAYFVDQLRQALNEQGISVDQTAVTAEPSPAATPELAFLQSPTLAELLVPTNRNSSNLYAESLLKTLGIAFAAERPDQATEAGTAAATTLLTRLGLAADSFVLADGSGLSRHNLVTPATLVHLLQVMANHPQAAIYRNSLAVAGTNGTLRSRLQDTPLQGNFYGKSGALSRNVTLSGYLTAPNYRPLVVSILINNADQRAAALRQVIDEMLLTLAQVKDCSER